MAHIWLRASVPLWSLYSCAAQAADVVVVRRAVQVNAPAAEIWGRVGSYCAIAEWLKVTCTMPRGDGDVGSVRVLNSATQEIMVAKSPLSYTYYQTVGTMSSYGYHGTLAVEPAGSSRAKIVYTLVYDQATMPNEKKALERTRIEERFQGAIETMKAMVEAG